LEVEKLPLCGGETFFILPGFLVKDDGARRFWTSRSTRVTTADMQTIVISAESLRRVRERAILPYKDTATLRADDRYDVLVSDDVFDRLMGIADDADAALEALFQNGHL